MRSLFLAFLFFTGVLVRAEISVEIDLPSQTAYLLQDGQRVYASPISSGRASHRTPSGDFFVAEKDLDHRSSMYGRVVDAAGDVVEGNADSSTPVPEGGRFVQAPMRHFMRFDGAVGMHAGHLPGYAASHGCVRMPPEKARLFYNVVTIGTPVHVIGRAPAGRVAQRVSSKAEPVVLRAEAVPRRSIFSWFHRSPSPARTKANTTRVAKSAAR